MRNNKRKNYFYFMTQELELRKDFSGTIFIVGFMSVLALSIVLAFNP